MPKLLAEDLTKEFPTRSGPLVVLRGASLALDPGESVAVVGPSGSGKSTLLDILGALARPTAGRVVLGDCETTSLGESELAGVRAERIGFVFQDHHLLPQCSVLENVLVPTLALGRTTREQVERARALLDRVGLAARLDHRPAELSGGERQRAALARALVNQPELILADEPTGNLDHATAERVGQLLLELQDGSAAMLVVATHSTRLAAMLGRRLELDDGRLREWTHPA